MDILGAFSRSKIQKSRKGTKGCTDRDNIWHTCVNRSGNGTKNSANDTPGGTFWGFH